MAESRLRGARIIAFLAVCALSAVLGAEPSRAAVRPFHTIVQDDTLALSAGQVRGFVRELKSLGVDELRVSAEWKLEAPNPNGSRMPAHFDPWNPSSYDDSPGMQALDRAVRVASAAGLGVIIDPSFSAPRWATHNARPAVLAGDPWYNDDISIRAIVAWETMLAQRYAGAYTPAGASSPLPRVGTFTLWNEPNQSGFLTPQWHAHVPVSADWYRALVRAAYPAIKRASRGATVLIGNTSSTGADPQAGNGGVPPLTFIRRLACVNAALEPITTGACAHFRMLPADGYAQHPYERMAPPWVASQPGAGDAQMGDVPALQALLDRLVAMHRLAPGAANLWLTEQGYSSNGQLGGPWSQGMQADFNADSEYLAWEDPQVVSFSQFLLRDTLTAETLMLRAKTGNDAAMIKGTWTTGLEREDGSPKPALTMFRTPVVARFVSLEPAIGTPFGGLLHPVWEKVEVWGRVRSGHAPTPVIIEANDSLLGFWRNVATTTTDANGIFDIDVIVNRTVPTSIRFSWLNRPTGWQTSPETKPVVMESSG